MGQTKKTNNSFLDIKIKLRLHNVPKGNLKVLDCFSGESLIWNRIKLLSKNEIQVIGIDKNNKNKYSFSGDNVKYLKTINLKNFNVIDLDAYGIPYEQLKIILSSDYNGIIFITFIQSLFGALPRKMLYELGYTKSMVDKIPSVFYKNGFDKFKMICSYNNIKKIKYYQVDNKYYICINKENI